LADFFFHKVNPYYPSISKALLLRLSSFLLSEWIISITASQRGDFSYLHYRGWLLTFFFSFGKEKKK